MWDVDDAESKAIPFVLKLSYQFAVKIYVQYYIQTHVWYRYEILCDMFYFEFAWMYRIDKWMKLSIFLYITSSIYLNVEFHATVDCFSPNKQACQYKNTKYMSMSIPTNYSKTWSPYELPHALTLTSK